MLDIKTIREKQDEVRRSIKARGLDVDLDKLLKVDEEYSDLLVNVETHRALKNKLSEDVSKVDVGAKEKLIEEAMGVKKELSKMEKELSKIAGEREVLLRSLPNLLAGDVVEGGGEEDNKVIRTVGEPTKFSFKPKDHAELGKDLGLINLEKASEVAGARFVYLLGDLPKLQFALIQYVLDLLTNEKVISKIAKKAGNPNTNVFIPMLPPAMVRKEVMDKMDRLEPREERYILEKDNLVLNGSAEHTMGPFHMEDTFDDSDLPKRYVGYTTAFRREAGSYGKDTKGFLRMHQFDKLEMESFTRPEDGLLEQEFFVAIQEHIVSELKIPYQVVMICTGDMGKPDYRQVDINCFLPGQNKYRETHTADYMTDFQSRRLNIKQKNGEFVHMNDATAVAGRMLIAIMENYQQEDGSIRIPKVLHKYMGKKVIK